MAHEQFSTLLFEKDVASLSDAIAKRMRLTIVSKEWPVLDVIAQHITPLRMRFQCDGWDDQPPSITLLKADGSNFQNAMPGGIFHNGPHPTTGLPFVCMRGAREYHTHPSHLTDAWDNYRAQEGMNIVGILMQVVRQWRRLVR